VIGATQQALKPTKCAHGIRGSVFPQSAEKIRVTWSDEKPSQLISQVPTAH